MSGPKSFSVHVFDARLKEIFSIQSQINQLFKELSNYKVDDKELAINFDCTDFIEANESELNKQLKNFSLGYKGTVEQSKYDSINSKVEKKLKQLRSFLAKANSQKKDFLDKRQDYLSYVSYDNYYNNAHQSFNRFKTELTGYLKKNIEEKQPEVFEKSKEQIEKIEPDIKKGKFEFGFRKKEQKSKEEITQHFDKQEEKASSIRNEIAKKAMIQSFTQNEKEPDKAKENEKEEIAKLVNTIENKIDAVEDDKLRLKFKAGLEKLKQSEVFTDIYFYKEFFDNLSQSEKTQSYKKQIKDALYELNTSEFTQGVSQKKSKLQQYAVELLEAENIKNYQIENFQSQCHFLKEENKELIEAEFVKKKENEFLKQQLVNGLQNLNYKVMDNMEVIDFEKQSDFLFKVPNQKNYVNLRINNDNDIAYNFLIEEDKDQLSFDEKKEKVIEMEQTCKSFKDVLKELEAFGLDIEMTKASEADMEKLMQVPEKYRDKIEKAEQEQERARERELKKKYLDGG
jgi:hypothetical protein